MMPSAFSEVSAVSYVVSSTCGLTSRDAIARGVDLLAADVLGAVQDLALQVGDVDDVEIHEADVADAGGGEVERERRAEPAGADQQDARRLEPLLSLERRHRG